MRKLDFFILTFILVLAFVFRLYKISTPLADLHSWRQSDTSAVTRNFVKRGVDLFHPRYDDLSSNQTGKENPEGYRFVEFPLYNAITATVYKLYPVLSIEVYGRLISAIFSLFIVASLYYLSLKERNRMTAVIASLVYSIFPFFVFFSRVILPETTSLSLVFLAMFFLYLFTNSKKKILSIIYYLLSLVFFALSLLVKPPALFYATVLFAVFFHAYRFSLFKKPQVYLYFILGLIPLVLWRLYIQNYPEGSPPSDWLITSVNTYQGLQNIFFRPAFFRWIFFERINNYMLGGFLTFFFVLGILAKHKKTILTSIFISAFAYLFVFQGGNVQHEYYQTYILPAIALLVGTGASVVFENRKLFYHPIISSIVVFGFFALSFFFSFYKVKDYYSYPSELPQIANVVKTLTNEDDKIVTDRTGDTTLLYLTERRGAPSIYKEPAELKKLGYTYLVTLHEDLIEKLKQERYKVVFENKTFAMFAL
jgi:hypothetical protein